MTTKWTPGKRAWWAVDRSTGLEDYPNHGFGAWASYYCEHCESPIFDEPELVCVARQTMSSPAEHEWVCPHCGSGEVNEWTQHRPSLAVVRRYYIHRNPYYREAV